jgi:hypothetical protein
MRSNLTPRVAHALALAPKDASYDSIRFLLSVSVTDQYTRFVQAKSTFFDLKDYIK